MCCVRGATETHPVESEGYSQHDEAIHTASLAFVVRYGQPISINLSPIETVVTLPSNPCLTFTHRQYLNK